MLDYMPEHRRVRKTVYIIDRYHANSESKGYNNANSHIASSSRAIIDRVIPTHGKHYIL